MTNINELVKDTLKSYNEVRKTIISTIIKIVEIHNGEIILPASYEVCYDEEYYAINRVYIDNGTLHICYKYGWRNVDSDINNFIDIGFDTDTFVYIMDYLAKL